MIQPRVLKGFRDTLPGTMIKKKEIIARLEHIFENYGFVPIDTPALEYTEILLGKGSGETDKQIYRFNDHGGRDVAMRFDLTVPLARYVSQHFNELTFPFKRYHIAPVWRGENTQRGRYREFYQCDFDILGTTSVESDIEILLCIKAGLLSLNTGDFKIHVNNRRILNSLLKARGLENKQVLILRAIDKLYKIGLDNVVKELTGVAGLTSEEAENILVFLNLKGSGSACEITGDDIFILLDKLKNEFTGELTRPVLEMEHVFTSLKKTGVLDCFAFNPAITRGLDYYTGIVFETFVTDRKKFGSICSGGRYDNLTGLYSKTAVPGVGASFGLDRIIALLEDKELLQCKESRTELLLFHLDSQCTAEYHKLAEEFRKAGIRTEVFFDNKKIGQQFKMADKKSIPFVLFAGSDDFAKGTFNLKNQLTGRNWDAQNIRSIIDIIKES